MDGTAGRGRPRRAPPRLLAVPGGARAGRLGTGAGMEAGRLGRGGVRAGGLGAGAAGLGLAGVVVGGVVLLAGLRLRARLAERDRELSALRRAQAALRHEHAALRHEHDALLQRSAALTELLRAEARTDALTGLANRRHWNEQLLHELSRAGRAQSSVAVAVVDLDRFKLVNDTLGHAAGDELLRDVAARFLRAVRTVDLVARVGGEEFAVALPDVSRSDAVTIVERLRTSLAEGVTCSAGLALWDGQESAEALQRRADAALYRAKEAGRDRLVVG